MDELPQGFGIRPANSSSDFHWLYWGRCPVVRSRDAERLVNALEHHLSVPSAAVADQLLWPMSAVVSVAGEAFLLPKIGASIARFDRPLRAAGMTVVDVPLVAVDPSTGELVVDAPTVTLAGPARDTLLEALGTTSEEGTVAPGRYPIAAWLAESGSPPDGEAAAITHLLGGLQAPTTPRGADGVQTLVRRLRKVAVTMRDVTSVLSALASHPS